MKKLLSVFLAVIMLMGSTVSITAQEKTDDSELNAGDIFSITSVTFNKGAESWTEEYVSGNKINYPTLTASRLTDNAWSLSDSGLVAVPKNAQGSQLSVFYYENPEISFENYYIDKYASKSMVVKPSEDIAYNGNKSMKLTNAHYSILDEEPTDWDDNYNNYYQLVDGEFVKNNYEDVPAFSSETFYHIRNNQLEHSILLGQINPSAYYQVTFKYYVKNPLTSTFSLTPYTSHSNLWGEVSDDGLGKRVIYSQNGFAVDSSVSTGEWHIGVINFKSSDYAVSGFNWLYLRIQSDKTNNYDNLYIDDVSVRQLSYVPTIIYHYNNGEPDLVIDNGVELGEERLIDSIPAVPDGKYFMGWYSDAECTKPITSVKVPDAPIDDKAEAHAYAKWGEYGASYDMSYVNYNNPTAQGYGYMLNGEYRNTITEGGWAVVNYTDEGISFTKKETSGQANLFNPEIKDDLVQYSGGGGYITDTKFGKDTHAIGEETDIGWSVKSTLTLKDSDGNIFVAKPNTKYTAVITYKVNKAGNSSFMFTAGRPYGYADKGANDFEDAYYNDKLTQKISNASQKVTGEYLTAMSTLTTGDFSNSLPVLSIHASVSGYRARRVKEAYGVESYTYVKDEVEHTVYPYEIISVPEFVIKEITLVEVENGKAAVAYNFYCDGEGFSAELSAGSSSTEEITLPETDSVDRFWYKDKAAYERYESSYYPSENTMLYNANYVLSHVNESPDGYAAYLYSGAKGLSPARVDKNGETVNALNYNPYGYDEYNAKYFELYGRDYGDKDQPVSEEVDKVERMNSTLEKGANMFRLGKVKDGHTYKISFAYKAEVMNTDLILRFATAHKNNIYMFGSEITRYTISKSQSNEWKQLDMYITADLGGTVSDVAGGDDTIYSLGYEELYLSFIQKVTNSDLSGEDNNIYFTDITVTDLGTVIKTGTGSNSGVASILKEEELANTDGLQAIRYYFNYETVDGFTLTLDGKPFNVVERGFIYKNGSIAKYATNSVYLGGMTIGSADTVTQKKTGDFNYCWEYTDSKMTFSTYINRFDDTMADYELIVRGFITFVDDNNLRHTIYSDTINRSVNYIKDNGTSTIDPNRRYLVWSAGIEGASSVNDLNDIHQDTNVSYAEGNYGHYDIVKGGDNWFIDENGAMVMRVTYADGYSSADGADARYTMAKSLSTKNKMSYKYGYLEFEAEVPFMWGTSAGFWLRPQYEFDSSYTLNTRHEIDIFETFGLKQEEKWDWSSFGYKTYTYGILTPQLHKWYSIGDGKSESVQIGHSTTLFTNKSKIFMDCEQGATYTYDVSKSFYEARKPRKYGFEWTPEYLAFYVDPVFENGILSSEPYYKIDISGDYDYYGPNGEAKDDMKSFHEESYVCFSNAIITSASSFIQEGNYSDLYNILEKNDTENIDFKIYSCKLYQYRHDESKEYVNYH